MNIYLFLSVFFPCVNIFFPLPPLTFPKFVPLTHHAIYLFFSLFLHCLAVFKNVRMEPQGRLLIYKSTKSLLAPFICLDSMVSQQTVFYLLYLEGLYPVVEIKIFLSFPLKNSIFYHVILLAHCSVTESWFFQTTFPKPPNPICCIHIILHFTHFSRELQIPGEEEPPIKVTGMPVGKLK